VATEAEVHELEAELTRVVDRLNSMTLTRAGSAADDCYDAAELILGETRLLTDDIPIDAIVPRLAAQGLGSLLAVVGEDYEKAVEAAPQADVRPVIDRLVELRRSLP